MELERLTSGSERDAHLLASEERGVQRAAAGRRTSCAVHGNAHLDTGVDELALRRHRGGLRVGWGSECTEQKEEEGRRCAVE